MSDKFMVRSAIAMLHTALRIIEDAAPGAFKNGVTDPTGTIDEGEVLTFNFVRQAHDFIDRQRQQHE